jgi:hypothetical protein
MSATARGTRPAAIERQAHLAPAQVGRTWAVWLPAGQKTDIVGHPIEHIASQPADPPAVEYAFSRESAEHHHTE